MDCSPSRRSIFVTELDNSIRPLLASGRSDSGIVVVAQTAGPNADTGLRAADIIRAIDRTLLHSISQFLPAGYPSLQLRYHVSLSKRFTLLTRIEASG
jgi:hypothetical protein